MFVNQRRMPSLLCATVLVVNTAACKGDEPLSPTNYAGIYALKQVNGRDLGWFHQLAAVDCSAAFTAGSLVITENKQFQLRLDYNFRCVGVNPYDGHDVLIVTGTDIKTTDRTLVLNGIGPDMIGGSSADRWSLDLRPDGLHVDVAIWGLNGQWWGDPVFRMGPRAEYNGPCFIGC